MTDIPPPPPDKDELRRRLSLEYVCAKLGVRLDRGGYALCPFHADTRPSFYLWDGDDCRRWFCQPCGFGGDVFDLLMRLEGLTFPQALDRAAAMLAELPPGYEPPRPEPAPVRYGPDSWCAELDRYRQLASDPSCAGLLAARTGLAQPENTALCARWDEYLRGTWGWGLDEAGCIYMPHWTPDGQLAGCKIRDGSGRKHSLPGSRYEHLYGCWLGRRSRSVLLCEGETDAAWAGWAAAHARLELDIFALPSGTGKSVESAWLSFLAGATVYLALDPDDAGVRATREWLCALADAGFSDVRVCRLPLGRDLRDAHPDLPALLATAKRPLREPDDMQLSPAGYLRSDRRGGVRTVTTWTVEPTAALTGDEGGYDVVLEERGARVKTVLRLGDLASTAALNRWANRHSTFFLGSESDRQRLVELIHARGAIVPEVFQTDRVGLHAPPSAYSSLGPTIVYPHGWEGKVPWRYLPVGRTADVSDRVLLPLQHATSRFAWSWLESFLALSSSDVTHPLLAWLIAAARRPEARRFPVLFVGGSSGVGKSTLASLALRLMGSRIEMTLGAATPFTLLRTLSATTSIPVLVDEWTRLGRRDAREALQASVPDLYAGGLVERGQADLSVQSYRLTSPTIIAGEDVFTLDRERERMISIWPTLAAQDHEALERVQNAPLERFGALLHRWLATSPLDLPPLESDAEDRAMHNAAVLRAGWATLLRFLDYAASFGDPVPALPAEPDMSCLARLDEDDENAYETAVIEGAALTDKEGAAMSWPDAGGRGTWFRSQALLGLLETRRLDIELPGRSKAMIGYFRERYGIESGIVTPPFGVRAVRAHLILGFHLPSVEQS